ncbi:hypothetical protein GGF31_004650 [Allomyces arbusculus]|nr:hypothetical protein GGF31_004650 [Allomyces arbusculus]
MDLAPIALAATTPAVLASARFPAGFFPAGIRAAGPFPVGALPSGPVPARKIDWTPDAASPVSGPWVGRDEQTAVLDGGAAQMWAARVAGSAATSDLHLVDSNAVPVRRDADPRVWAALAAQAAAIGVQLPACGMASADPPGPPLPDVREATKTVAVPDDAASPAAPAARGAAADAAVPQPTPMSMTTGKHEAWTTGATEYVTAYGATAMATPFDEVMARAEMPPVQPFTLTWWWITTVSTTTRTTTTTTTRTTTTATVPSGTPVVDLSVFGNWLYGIDFPWWGKLLAIIIFIWVGACAHMYKIKRFVDKFMCVALYRKVYNTLVTASREANRKAKDAVKLDKAEKAAAYLHQPDPGTPSSSSSSSSSDSSDDDRRRPNMNKYATAQMRAAASMTMRGMPPAVANVDAYLAAQASMMRAPAALSSSALMQSQLQAAMMQSGTMPHAASASALTMHPKYAGLLQQSLTNGRGPGSAAGTGKRQKGAKIVRKGMYGSASAIV